MKILFLCTGNSARSILAEGIARNHGHDARSAGSHPTGRVNPYALQELERRGIATQGLTSESWDAFSEFQFDRVITLCDQAAGEVCPIWPGNPTKLHWGLPDPATDANPSVAFSETYEVLEKLIRARLSP